MGDEGQAAGQTTPDKGGCAAPVPQSPASTRKAVKAELQARNLWGKYLILRRSLEKRGMPPADAKEEAYRRVLAEAPAGKPAAPAPASIVVTGNLPVPADDVAHVFVGGHSTVYLGLPGPRGRPLIPWPAGLEENHGASITALKGDPPEPEANAPYYGPGEFGGEFQAGIIGASVGVELMEVVDLIAGIFFVDLKGDDF